jgi:cytidylate kinase
MTMVVAIDGPSGAGKTTIAKLVAKELGYNYLDTGALYRAIAVSLRNKGVEADDIDADLGGILRITDVRFVDGKVYINGRDVSEEIRSKEIDHYSSVFSARKIVRDFLLDVQRNTALLQDVVVEGRDTTTVVFPDAGKKIFLDASLEERAKRRYQQYKEKGIKITMDEARTGMIDRDKRDSERDIAPLKVAADALFIDSSNLSIEQVIRKILDYVKSRD